MTPLKRLLAGGAVAAIAASGCADARRARWLGRESAAYFAGQAQAADDACPAEGTARSARGRALNRLKNRTRTPAPFEIDPDITLEALLAPGPDARRWSAEQAATVEGIVADVFPGSVETCNCNARDAARHDIHIVLASPLDPQARLIAEITPHTKALAGVESLAEARALVGSRVRITGWLMFDAEHADQAENTNPGGARNDVTTAWEIHPVMAVEVLE